MTRLLLACASVTLLILNCAVAPAEEPPLVVVHGPTIVAFFEPVRQEELEKDPDTNEALSDFQFYAGAVREPLKKMGIEFREVYARSFRVRIGKQVTTFRPGEITVGYYFVEPGKKPRIEYGVNTNSGLIEIAREYFGMAAKQSISAIRCIPALMLPAQGARYNGEPWSNAVQNGIRLEVIWFDEVEDLIEVLFRCSNGYFSGQAEIYASCEGLSVLAKAISGFPSQRSDSRDFELGTFNPDHADGGARLHFYCRDSAGHAVVEVKLRGNACDGLGEMESVALRIQIEAAAVDVFVKQLQDVRKTIGATACLSQAGL